MPDSSHTLQLYALALALVPDESDAGDLFMAARDEAHLRRLVAGWRQRHGLPSLADAPPLVRLSEEQREYGLHLARRRDRRTKSRLVLAALAVVLVLAGVRLLSQIPRPGVALAAEQAKAKQSAAFGLQVLRAEATPGAITVWWNYAGGRSDEADHPILVLGDSTFEAISVESRRESDGTITGSTTYQAITAGHDNARLQVKDRRTYDLLGMSEQFDLIWVSDPNARVIWREIPLLDHQRTPVGTIIQVTLGANYTILRYKPTRAIAKADTLEVRANGEMLEPYGDLAPMRYLTDGQELVFGPVPSGAKTLEVRALGNSAMSVSANLNPATDVVTKDGSETVVSFSFPQSMEAPWRFAFLVAGTESYPAEVREIDRFDYIVRYELRSRGIPPGKEVTAVQLHADRSFPGPLVPIDLSERAERPGG
jgi:hypothetical protein